MVQPGGLLGMFEMQTPSVSCPSEYSTRRTGATNCFFIPPPGGNPLRLSCGATARPARVARSGPAAWPETAAPQEGPGPQAGAAARSAQARGLRVAQAETRAPGSG